LRPVGFFIHTKLQSEAYQGGKEEATQAYELYVEEPDDAANAGRQMNVTWYQELSWDVHCGQRVALMGMAE
jgi:hypothetical protein